MRGGGIAQPLVRNLAPSPEILKSSLSYGDCHPTNAALQWRMAPDPYIREKFTGLRITARKLAAEYVR
jgi:hypothetical protein